MGLLLAAGGARRFGSQKLTAPFRGEPLVAHAARLLAAATDRTIVVVGNGGSVVRNALDGGGAEIVENPEWAEGMSTSLRCGVAAMPADAEAAIIALGDQPSLDASLVRAIAARWRETGSAIVAARYRGTVAPPVLLARSVFGEVAELRGDVGARALIRRDPARVSYVEVDADLPPDVDTPDDLAALGR